MVHVEYIIASLVAILVATFIVYKVANNILGLNLHIKPLLLCAVCAMFISLVLPKIIVGFAGLPGTLAALAIVAVIFAYFVARYENKTLLRQETREINAETETAPRSSVMEEGKSVDSVVSSGQLIETEEDKLKDSIALAHIESELAEAEISVSSSVNETIEPVTEDESQLVDQQHSNDQGEPDEQIKKEMIEEAVAANELIEYEQSIDPIVEEQPTDAIDRNEEKIQLNENNVSDDVSNKQSELPIIKPDSGETDNTVTVQESPEVILEEQKEDTVNQQMTLEDLKTDEIACEVETAETEAGDSDKEEALQLLETTTEDNTADDQLVSADSRSAVLDILTVANEEKANSTVIDRQDALEEDRINQQLTVIHNDLHLADDCDEIMHPVQSDTNIEIRTLSESKAEEPSQEKLEVSQLFSNKTDEQVEIQAEAASEPLLWQEDRGSNMNDSESTESVQFESEELDDLIDFAFSSKENQDFRTAFNAFSRALTLYPNSQAAPFLVVEIGDILKNKGDYDEAIKVFSNGRNFPQTKQDLMIEQEFISTIAYLRIIKNILLQNNLGDIPFSKIPPEIIKLIDEEFREWHNVSNF